MLYERLLKPVLFQMSAERAHHLTIGGMHKLGRLPGGTGTLRGMYGVERDPALAVNLWGIDFPHPVGLAAGLDKNAEAVRGFAAIGFGFMEVGTVTPKPQPGNEQPRLFRLPPDKALINRMGFNNVGAERMAVHLRAAGKQPIPVAVNIGKNKTTPNERAEDDYRECLRKLYACGDFFVVNISSPNTPDLRNLQHGDDLRRLLAAVKDEMAQQAKRHGETEKPILVKIAPDLTEAELPYMADTIAQSGVSGIIATNTTLSREGLTHGNRGETGGMSGLPLTSRSTDVVRRLYRLTEGKLPIIGCGGIFTARDAYDKIKAGASLVEVYTALIYEGPGLLRTLNAGLAELLRKDGLKHLTQAVGVESGM
ncbi:MAG: quinone-dependent dihydroorotate dehydrogenase [Paenibacillaceae bacterium]|nr:quinone-dependent dihydroorotate dehydrogenase [Paenibacillaceae bacterium]